MNNLKKKRILLILYVFFPYENANTNVMLPILDRLNEDYEVDILTCDLEKSQPEDEIFRGKNRVYRFRNWKRTFRKKVVSKALSYISQEGRESYEDSSFYDRAKQLCQKNQYDLIISQTSPFSTQWIVYLLYKNGVLSHERTRWIAYYTDPYAAYIGFTRAKPFRYEEENKVYQEADCIVVTPDQYWNDNLHEPFRVFLNKTVSIPLANVCPEKFFEIAPYSFSGERRYNCLYTGSLQDLSVRDPSYFLIVISRLADREEYRSSIHFHLVVNNVDSANSTLLEKIRNLPNVHMYSRLSLDTCLSMMAVADCLINVGNTCVNQLPSKVADYVSAGKPIINFYRSNRDTSKAFLANYPLALNILNRMDVREEDVYNVFQFVRGTAGRRLSPAEVRDIYRDRCADQVADYVNDVVREVIEN